MRPERKSKAMPRMSKKTPTADEIAEMAWASILRTISCMMALQDYHDPSPSSGGHPPPLRRPTRQRATPRGRKATRQGRRQGHGEEILRTRKVAEGHLEQACPRDSS